LPDGCFVEFAGVRVAFLKPPPGADSFNVDHSFNDPSGEAGKEGESLMLP
jgi:hypothetical protein